MIKDFQKEIINKLKDCIGYDAPEVTQEEFDEMVEYIKKNDNSPKERLFRLCGCYEGLDFNKVIDFFVDSRDSNYISELVSYVDGNLDQKYLVNKMIETNDISFVQNAIKNAGNAMLFSLEEEYKDKLVEFCNSKKEN